jgi:hypothetical protein
MAVNRNPSGHGTFCWIELGTSDPAAAKTFYAQLLGWKSQDMPVKGMEGAYTMFNLGGQEKTVAGMYKLMPEQVKQGVPPNWLPYVQVENVDALHKRAETLGARTLMPPMDVADMGRSVVLQDPTGAVFALWQVKGGGASYADQVHGNRCWNEVLSNNVDRAGKFYADLLGWTIRTEAFGGQPYHLFFLGEVPVAGMMAITKEMGQMPSSWMTYFHVDSCDATVKQLQASGGKALMPAFDMDGVGRVAVVMDPQGACFGFVQPPPQK